MENRTRSSKRRRTEAQESATAHCCPFPGCQKPYTSRSALKDHIITQNTLRDEHHSDSAVWETDEAKGLLVKYTRPGNLTPAEKRARKSASNKRDYRGHTAKRLAASAQRRTLQKEAMEVALELLKVQEGKADGQMALEGSTTGRGGSVVKDLYAAKPDITQLIIDFNGDVTGQTFGQLAAFYCQPNTWPPELPTDDDGDLTGEETVFSFLPSEMHYKLLQRKLHPDKAKPYQHPKIGTLLTAGWQIWQPILEDNELKHLKCKDYGGGRPEWFEEDSRRQVLLDMVTGFVGARMAVTEWLVPAYVSCGDIEDAFCAVEGAQSAGAAGGEGQGGRDEPLVNESSDQGGQSEALQARLKELLTTLSSPKRPACRGGSTLSEGQGA